MVDAGETLLPTQSWMGSYLFCQIPEQSQVVETRGKKFYVVKED